MWSGLLDLLYPRACVVCGQEVGEGGHQVCWDCRAGFPIVTEPFCRKCGDPADGVIEGPYTCGWCQRHKVHFDRARSAARYRGSLQAALCAFKYERATCLARDLADLLVACVRTHFCDVEFDAVASVPLHVRRQRDRTYNQAALLAAHVARRLRLSFAPRALVRCRDTATQTNLRATERKANVRGAFATRHDSWLRERYFLLVDDVMTTGATVAECSRVLKEAGAAAVYVVTVARG
jgi:ComF family protein